LNGQADIIVVEDRKQLEKILSIKDQIPTLKAIVQYTARRRSHHRQLTYAAPSSLFFLPYSHNLGPSFFVSLLGRIHRITSFTERLEILNPQGQRDILTFVPMLHVQPHNFHNIYTTFLNSPDDISKLCIKENKIRKINRFSV
jgi:hypothetical protein